MQPLTESSTENATAADPTGTADMPRRNRRYRKQPYEPQDREDEKPNYERMARRLVKAGTCSPLIIERPLTPTERQNT